MPALAQAATSTHCKPEEQVIFSCNVGKKVVSICASDTLGPASGTAQYRFGALGKIELKIPAQPQHPTAFSRLGVMRGPAWSDTHIRVVNGEYAYTVYEGEGKGWQRSGVLVTKKDQTLANLSCVSPRQGLFSEIVYSGSQVFANETEDRMEAWLDTVIAAQVPESSNSASSARVTESSNQKAKGNLELIRGDAAAMILYSLSNDPNCGKPKITRKEKDGYPVEVYGFPKCETWIMRVRDFSLAVAYDKEAAESAAWSELRGKLKQSGGTESQILKSKVSKAAPPEVGSWMFGMQVRNASAAQAYQAAKALIPSLSKSCPDITAQLAEPSEERYQSQGAYAGLFSRTCKLFARYKALAASLTFFDDIGEVQKGYEECDSGMPGRNFTCATRLKEQIILDPWKAR
jgi:uncharacterized protein YbbK (DUF523 family)